MINLNEIFKSSEKVNVEVNAAQGGIPNCPGVQLGRYIQFVPPLYALF